MRTFELKTAPKGFYDITAEVKQAVAESGVREGLCTIYCPHTTAGITINENADPDVVRDLTLALFDTFHDRSEFRHREGNSAAHLKSSVVGCSETVPITDGRLALGMWQGIYFTEFDGPRTRHWSVQIIGS